MTYDNTDTNADGAIDAPVDNDSVSTGKISDVADKIVSSSDSNLQSAVDDASSRGGGTVYIGKGTHSNHSYPITLPDDVAIIGPSPPSKPARGGGAAVLDAGGGDAIVVDNGGTVSSGFGLKNFQVDGTVRVENDTNADFVIENVVAHGADSNSGSGRGIEIRNNSFLYRVVNSGGISCDGAAVYIAGDGQAFINPFAFNSGDVIDGCSMYLSSSESNGGSATYFKPALGGFALSGSEAGIIGDALYIADIIGPQIEQFPGNNLELVSTTGKTANPRIIGGHIWGAGDNNLASNVNGGNKVVGGGVYGTVFRDATNDDIRLEGGTNSFYIESAYSGAGSNVSLGRISVTNNGFRNRASQQFVNGFRNGAADLTSEGPTFFNERAVHNGTDGNNTNAAGPAWNDDGTWKSIIDGGVID